jgi:hypothetical protein
MIGHVKLQELDLAIDFSIQLQSAHHLMNRSDAAITDCACSFGNLVNQVAVLKHRIGLVGVVLSFQPDIKIVLVLEVDCMVSFVHLECAPFGMYSENAKAHFIP